jgi:hypothetical protein
MCLSFPHGSPGLGNTRVALARATNRIAGFLLSVLFVLAPAVAATGGSIAITPSSVTSSPGGSGTFDVILTNPTGSGQTFNIAGFAVEVMVPSSSRITLTTATTSTASTSAAYLFQGNSFSNAHSNPSDPFYAPLATSITPTDMLLSDTVLTPTTFITVAPGSTFGLAHVSFTVASNAALGPVAVTLGPTIQLSNSQGGLISGFTTTNGQINIAGSAAVPEPSSFVMAAIAASSLALVGCYSANKRLPSRRSGR